MALSPIELCSRALLKIGANRIASFDEGTLEADIAATLYPTVRDAVLSAHPWNFATLQARLVKSATTPLADFTNAFQLPADCLRVLSAGSGDRGRGLTYRILQRLLLADAEDVVLTYVGRPAETDFPAYFDMMLIGFLAAEFCIPLTDSASRWEALHKAAELELRRTRLIDAQEESPARIDAFTLLEDRS